MAHPEFIKDDYFKIDVECHLSGDIKKYIEYRKNDEIQKILDGLNPGVEKRYNRFIDYG